MDLHLKDKVALVTGGSRGLGRAICLSLAAEGATVAVNYRSNAELAKQVVDAIQARGGARALAVYGDVSNEADVVAMFAATEENLSQVDILVNNAAVCPTRPLKDISQDEWNETFQVNLTGTFMACREMIRRLVAAQRPGRIVNVTSAAAFLGSSAGHAAYDATKGGMVSLTVSLAREVARHGIAVNAVAPGVLYTDMTAAILETNEAKYVARIPLRRIGRVEEVADVVALLASDRTSYMTGATVDVSGGLLTR